MSFILRSTLRSAAAATAIASSSSSRFPLPVVSAVSSFTRMRYNSTQSTPTPTPSSSELFPRRAAAPVPAPAPTPASSPSRADNFRNLRLDPGASPSTSSDPDAWWRQLSDKNKGGHPTHTSTGRSVPIPRGGDFLTGYKRLQGLLRSSNLKKELRIGEYHEKPSVRRRRLISERHRRRFREMVRTKVQQVISMRTRG